MPRDLSLYYRALFKGMSYFFIWGKLQSYKQILINYHFRRDFVFPITNEYE